MAIEFDAASFGEATLQTSKTVSHTIGSGDNRALVVATECNGSFLASLEYDGEAMTKIPEDDSAGGMELWYLLDPPVGAHNIIGTLAGTGYIKICGASYRGIDQADIIDVSGEVVYPGGSAADLALTLTTTVDGAWLVGCAFVNANADTSAGADTELRAQGKNPSGGLGLGDSGEPLSPGAHTIHLVSSSAGRSGLMFAMKPAADAGTTVDDSRDAETHGKATTTSNRDAEVHGQTGANDSRDAETTGSITSTDTRDAEAHGVDTTEDSRDAETRGSLGTNSAREAETHGQAATVAAREAETHGVDTYDEERDAELRGSQDTTDDRDAVLHGTQGGVAERAGQTHGIDNTTSERDAETHGSLETASSRGAEIQSGRLYPYTPKTTPYTAKTSPYTPFNH